MQQSLWDAGIFADVDIGTETFKKKIRNGEIAQYNFLLGTRFRILRSIFSLNLLGISRVVVGEDEVKARAVNVRNRDDVGTKARTPTIPFDDVMTKLLKLKEERRLLNRLDGEAESSAAQ